MSLSKKASIRILIAVLATVLIYWLPFFAVSLLSNPSIVPVINEIPESDAVIIFGTRVNERGEISPLLEERLVAGKAIYTSGKAPSIVVSNTEHAAEVMRDYLVRNGVPPEDITLDTQAETTPDTCVYEREQHGSERNVVFVSQQFHLARLVYQCSQRGITGVAFPANRLTSNDDNTYSLFTIVTIRAKRYTREAALTWLAVLRLY